MSQKLYLRIIDIFITIYLIIVDIDEVTFMYGLRDKSPPTHVQDSTHK